MKSKKHLNRYLIALLTFFLIVPNMSMLLAEGESTLRQLLDITDNNFYNVETAKDVKEIQLDLSDPDPVGFTGNTEFTDGADYSVIYHQAYDYYDEKDNTTHTLDLKLDFHVSHFNPSTVVNTGLNPDGDYHYYNGIMLLNDGHVEVSSYYRGTTSDIIADQWNEDNLTEYTVTHTFYEGDPNNGGVEYPITGLIGIHDPDNANYLFNTTTRSIYFEDKNGQDGWNGDQTAANEFIVQANGTNTDGLYRNLETGVRIIGGKEALGGFNNPELFIKLDNESSYTVTIQGWKDRVQYPILYELLYYTVTYNDGVEGEEVFVDDVHPSIPYGEDTPDFRGETKREGYTFAGWTPEIEDTVTKNMTYYATWVPNPDTKYTVEFYYEKNGEYSETPDSSETRTGTTDTKAEVTDDDKKPSLEDYILDPNADHVFEGTISGDGKLVLKVYFKQKFTVIYEPGDHGTFAKETNPNLDYGVDTPKAPEPTGETGYVFAGWSPVIEDKVTRNMTYVAQWRPIIIYTIPTTGIE